MDIKQFKKWLIDNGLEEDDLFSEALKCYQIEAYKASFLYSYLGFVNFIKEIILNLRRLRESSEELLQKFKSWIPKNNGKQKPSPLS